MINYSSLPGRVRRVTKVYDYCIEEVVEHDHMVRIKLKDGYTAKDNSIAIETKNMEEVIYFLKAVVHPVIRKMSVALFSFQCQLNCGNTIQKGQNYIDLDGMKLCSYCGLKEK
jgi:hypothetical protein